MADKRKSLALSLIKNYWFVPLSIIICIVIATNVKMCFVVGESMQPVLENEDCLLLNLRKTPERYDIIVFKSPEDGSTLIKRVVGLPGETVFMKDNKLYIDGKQIEEDPVINTITEDYGCLAGDGITLSNTGYLVLGDNRNNSRDSRYFGEVDSELITGVVMCRFPSLKEV